MSRGWIACLVGCLTLAGCGSGEEYNTLPPEQLQPPKVVKNPKPSKKPPAAPQQSKLEMKD